MKFEKIKSNLKSKAQKLKADIPAVFLCLKDSATPFSAKILGGITIAYALSPIDLIPDFIPVFGYLDDIFVLPALVALTIHFIPKPVWDRNLALAVNLWKNGKPKKWYYAVPILFLWLLFVRAILTMTGL